MSGVPGAFISPRRQLLPAALGCRGVHCATFFEAGRTEGALGNVWMQSLFGRGALTHEGCSRFHELKRQIIRDQAADTGLDIIELIARPHALDRQFAGTDRGFSHCQEARSRSVGAGNTALNAARECDESAEALC